MKRRDFNGRAVEALGIMAPCDLAESSPGPESPPWKQENTAPHLTPLLHRMKVFVPTGYSAFPSELLHAPEKWVKVKYPKLISYSYMKRGGHFATFEEPKLLAQDIRKFVSLAELQ